MRFSGYFLCLWAGLLGPCFFPMRSEARSCRVAWSALPEAARSYRFDSDEKRTAKGNQGYRDYANRIDRASCEKEWSVLLYMAADAPDLVGPALSTLRRLEQGTSSSSSVSGQDIDVIAQLDLFRPAGIRRLHLFRAPPAPQGTPEADKQDPAGLRSPIAEWLDEETIPPAESLSRFLIWSIKHYPARRYMVVVWGHGLGFEGIAVDRSQRTILDLPSARSALLKASRDALAGRPFDLILADACLMQSIEVAAELSGAARFFVGSESKFDYQGLPYTELLSELGRPLPLSAEYSRCTPSDVACAFAAELPERVRSAIENRLPTAAELREDFILSAVDLHAVTSELQPAMHRLGASLTSYLREDPMRSIALLELLSIKTGLDAANGVVPDFLGGTRDIGVFLFRLRGAARREAERSPSGPSERVRRLLAEIDRTQAALTRATLGLFAGSRYSSERFAGLSGMSVWLPRSQRDYAERSPLFATSLFYRESGAAALSPHWQEWLGQLFGRPSGADTSTR